MNFINLQKRVAENLNMLSGDDSTIIEGKVTVDSIKRAINDVYLEILFPIISNKFPKEFEQFTYPLNTYTTTGTVDISSTGKTLVSTTSIFANSMEGFRVYNSDLDVTARIVKFTNATTVQLDIDINDDWDGDTIYILGNEFTFGNETLDLKEVSGVYIKYLGSEQDFTPVSRTDNKLARFRERYYSTHEPYFYNTVVKVGNDTYPAVGILPFPVSINGQILFSYIQKPSPLVNDSDEPRLKTTGLHQVIINGATAQCKRIQGAFEEASQYEEVNRRTGDILPKGTAALIASYQPNTRSGAKTLKLSPFISSLGRL